MTDVILSAVKNLNPSYGLSRTGFFSRGVYPEPDPSVALLPQDDEGEGLPQDDRAEGYLRMMKVFSGLSVEMAFVVLLSFVSIMLYNSTGDMNE